MLQRGLRILKNICRRRRNQRKAKKGTVVNSGSILVRIIKSCHGAGRRIVTDWEIKHGPLILLETSIGFNVSKIKGRHRKQHFNSN